MQVATLSIVTVSMNRTEHVIQCAHAASRCCAHLEHVIVDWSSDPPLMPDLLPADPRTKLLRVDGEVDWHASRAYNFGFAAACGSHVLRLDADQIVSARFFRDNYWNDDAILANDFTIGDELIPSSTGLVFVPSERFAQAGGFNEYLSGWGYEDVDLLSRLRGFCKQKPLDVCNRRSIEHSDAKRPSSTSKNAQELPDSLRKSFSNARNRWLARAFVWNSDSPHSIYRQEGSSWRAQFVPVLPEWLAQREDAMVPRLELETLFRSPIEISADRVYAAHRRVMVGETYRLGVALGLVVRIHARLVNWLLLKLSR